VALTHVLNWKLMKSYDYYYLAETGEQSW